MIKGEWMMVMCVPYARAFKLVVFKKWAWNNDDVKGLLEKIAVHLRDLVLGEGLKISWLRHKELAVLE